MLPASDGHLIVESFEALAAEDLVEHCYVQRRRRCRNDPLIERGSTSKGGEDCPEQTPLCRVLTLEQASPSLKRRRRDHRRSNAVGAWLCRWVRVEASLE
eukprot:CAMPEP_0206497878 /NCGR_PEP_ID=MMETSP0324_2-20121206/50550_1 /ASSEMBLY_ACC=CAM_ASM_000836 /TAXON_ID=2866 /ORGANISM="Crypthecodinium cohnii, Strain Seligo" /LENGTH=99 /DNA_ID=CAMNT_0053983737 /DNA_START=197 /DNA_END=496 /DNA_ORIENTATION=+